MKKISGFLAAIMLVMTVLSPFSAYADSSFDDMLSRAVTAELDSFCSSIDNKPIKASKAYSFKGKKYYGEGREIYTLLRDKIDNMDSGFTVNYFSRSKMHPTTIFGISGWRYETLSNVYDMILGATDERLSVTCTDGDYSRWNMYEFGIENFKIINDESGKYCYSFDMIIRYRYNKFQEATLTDKVNEIVSNVRQMGLSDYDAMLYIHDYICNSTTYDNAAVKSPGSYPASFSAYGALISGKCVCQGYSLAFYRICKVLGFDVRFIASDPERGNHAWNLVGLDGKYYFVDLTWDDNIRDEKITEYSDYEYFLVNYADLRRNDRGTYTHTIYNEYFDNDYFNSRYRSNFAINSYSKDKPALMSTAKITLSSTDYKYTGSEICPQTFVYDKNGNMLTENVDYTISYSDNKKCGLGIVTVNGLGALWGMSSARSFQISPKTVGAIGANAKENSLKLTWENDGADGYTVQMYRNGKWSDIGTAYTNSYSVKNLEPAKKYKFRIKPYERINRKKYSGTFSQGVTVCTAPRAVSLKSTSRSGKSLTASWRGVSCDGYQLQYSTDKAMKQAKSVRVSKSSSLKKTVKGLKSGKKYYVRVRAYKAAKDGAGKTRYYYGKWSSKKAV